MHFVASTAVHLATKTSSHSWRRLALQSTSGREDPSAGDSPRGEGVVRKGQRVRRVRWPSISTLTPRPGHLLSTCAVCMHLLAVETHPFHEPAFCRHFIFHPSPDDWRLRPGRKPWLSPTCRLLQLDSHRSIFVTVRLGAFLVVF